jgi:RsiW-degrading membrane proteinase PrsW (M82 family)
MLQAGCGFQPSIKIALAFPGRFTTMEVFAEENSSCLEHRMALIVTLFFGFAPMFLFAYILYWLDRYEKEPIFLLGAVFLWGMVVAAGGAYILNTIFGITMFVVTGSESASELAMGSLSAPIVEESLKGMAVLLVFALFYREFDSVLDGIIYAGVAALGFAATENSIYIWRGFEAGGWEGLFQLTFVRVILVGWQHPFYTSFTGIGLAFARLNRSLAIKIIAPVAGLGIAMLNHSIHNTLASFSDGLTCFIGLFLDWSGVFFMFCMILWATWIERRNLINHLREEVEMGLISKSQYRTACSATARSFACLSGLFSGKFMATTLFYQACGELAHKKEQLRLLGPGDGTTHLIQQHRAKLAQLAPQALTS